MSIIVAFTMVMVVFGVVGGIMDIVRDLILDCTRTRDWNTLYVWETDGWETAPVSHDLDYIDWFLAETAFGMGYGAVKEEKLAIPMVVGWNRQDILDAWEHAADMSDEGSLEPIFIDIRSSVLDEISNEYRAQSYTWRSGSQEGYVDVM